MTTRPRPHQEEPDEPEPELVFLSPDEALRRARPLPPLEELQMRDIPPEEAAAFHAAIAEL